MVDKAMLCVFVHDYGYENLFMTSKTIRQYIVLQPNDASALG
jgi:hypothetical protein